MVELYLYFLFICLAIILILFLIPYFKPTQGEQVKLNEITVLIPFRNEELMLPRLLESIKKQTAFPSDVFFINDHSDDNSLQLILSFIAENNLGKVIELSEHEKGKKIALQKGIEECNSKYVLTIDADVVLEPGYFESLSKTEFQSLNILPVITEGKGIMSSFFGVEYLFLNSFNYLLSPIYPISSSGANLLIELSESDYVSQLEEHKEIASGDDYFLLRYFRDNKKSIKSYNQHSLSVNTDAPTTLSEYFNQRIRWFGKSNVKIRFGELCFGVFTLLYFLGGFVALIVTLINNEIQLFLWIFITHLLIDVLVFLRYTIALKQQNKMIYLPFFQLIYPLLFLMVIVGAVFYRPQWKGRKI